MLQQDHLRLRPKPPGRSGVLPLGTRGFGECIPGSFGLLVTVFSCQGQLEVGIRMAILVFTTARIILGK